jgi:hypothetical protein
MGIWPMSFYPITVNYWTMRESGFYVEGKRDMPRLVPGDGFFVISPDRLLSLQL